MPRNRGEYNVQNLQNDKARPVKSQANVAQGGSWSLVCGMCSKNHTDKCRDSHSSCFECGKEGFFMK